MPDSGGRLQVVVGLGNPGAAYDGTPHNVGHRVSTSSRRPRRRLGARPRTVAGVEGDGRRRACQAGGADERDRAGLARSPGGWASGGRPILVHDDLDLPVRSVRVRTRSGDGGHRGVRSVLQAFRTDEIRRVRVGVGRPERGQPIEEFVLALRARVLADVDGAVAEAADRVLELLGRPERIRARANRGRGAAA